MDFTNSAFRTPAPPSKVSSDIVSHANMVMACRFGWSSTPDSSSTSAQTSNASASTTTTTTVSAFNNIRTKRFAPCQGRLYHQLLCSHRVRTDLVENCGVNCVEPAGDVIDTTFLCNECIQGEASTVWESRKAQHNAQYPSMGQMTEEQYNQWYAEHRQLEADFNREHNLYLTELRAKTRPSNICSSAEATKEEMEIAKELDSLSLSLMRSNHSPTRHDQLQPPSRSRTSLPNDVSEQLHWNLNSLALERGACSVEFSASQANAGMPTVPTLDPGELWRKPRDKS